MAYPPPGRARRRWAEQARITCGANYLFFSAATPSDHHEPRTFEDERPSLCLPPLRRAQSSQAGSMATRGVAALDGSYGGGWQPLSYTRQQLGTTPTNLGARCVRRGEVRWRAPHLHPLEYVIAYHPCDVHSFVRRLVLEECLLSDAR